MLRPWLRLKNKQKKTTYRLAKMFRNCYPFFPGDMFIDQPRVKLITCVRCVFSPSSQMSISSQMLLVGWIWLVIFHLKQQKRKD